MQEDVGVRTPRLSGTVRVWILTVLVAGLSVALYVSEVLHLAPLSGPVVIPWWLLAGMFYLSELSVVHFRFREDAHSFSLSEVPLVVGLFFTDPVMLVPAQLLGTALALLVHRRQPPLKLAFNLAQFALQTCLAVMLFRSLVTLGDVLGPAGWFGALLATLAALWAADVLINMAIYLSGDRLPPQKMWEVLGLGVVATAMNTSLALVAVTILAHNPGAVWLSLTPLVALYVAYRAYSSKRAQHERLESLYEATRALHQSPQLESAMATAVSQTRKLLDARMAEIILLPQRGGDVAFSTRLGADDRCEVMRPMELDLGERLWEPVISGRQARLLPRPLAEGGPRG
ncbi:MAG: hypothetical protein ACRD02_15365, partial [Acidimicrobiia bacterium]